MVKEHTITWWRKKAWKVFSAWIKKRDKNICFTSGKYVEGSNAHAGHFLTGATCPPSLYFDPRNVHCQSFHDNVNLSGNWPVYEERMINKYGIQVVDELKKLRRERQGEKWEIADYQRLIEYYRD